MEVGRSHPYLLALAQESPHAQDSEARLLFTILRQAACQWRDLHRGGGVSLLGAAELGQHLAFMSGLGELKGGEGRAV